jgi:hypothetical protein
MSVRGVKKRMERLTWPLPILSRFLFHDWLNLLPSPIWTGVHSIFSCILSRLRYWSSSLVGDVGFIRRANRGCDCNHWLMMAIWLDELVVVVIVIVSID